MPTTLPLIVRSGREICPRERAVWRSFGCFLNRVVVFESSQVDELIVLCGDRCIRAPAFCENNQAVTQQLQHKGKMLDVLAEQPPRIIDNGTFIEISEDFITTAIRFAALFAEDGIVERASDGTMSAFSVPHHATSPDALQKDYGASLLWLLSNLLQVPTARIHPGGAPFSVVFTCDVDGVYDGVQQSHALMSVLDAYGVDRPTFMFMTETAEEKTLYDPIYSMDEEWVQDLIRRDIGIGLHSSFGALYDRGMMRAQLERLEVIAGRKVLSHRAHFLRYKFPATVGYLHELGVHFDSSQGYYDGAGYRNGSSLPVYIPDPGGRGRGVWSLPLTILDQHLFMEGHESSPGWKNDGSVEKEKRRAALLRMLDRASELGGVVTLDWHLHTVEHEHTPFHLEALKGILDYAQNKGAWIGGVEAFFEGIELLHGKHVAPVENFGLSATATVIENTEAAFYAEKMSETSFGVAEYVDATASTIRALLPKSAERIIDVGAGHGWISHRIPPFHKVMCVDLSEDIMREVARPRTIGSITDLPFENRSVEMVMASDVVEHLDINDYKRAMTELDRVAQNYIYLQVPNDEALQTSSITCPKCGEIWHKNFHKRSFVAQNLIEGMPSGWEVSAIAYTGNLPLIDNATRDIADSIARNEGIVGFPGEHICPFCESKFTLVGEDTNPIFDQLYQEAAASRQRQTAQASEVGVLFRRGAAPISWIKEGDAILLGRNGTRTRLPEASFVSDNMINMKDPIQFDPVGHRGNQPHVFLPDSILKPAGNGARLAAHGSDNARTIFFCFPRPANAENFVLEFVCDQRIAITITCFDANWDEIVQRDFVVTPRDTSLSLGLPFESTVFAYRVIVSGDLLFRRAYIDNPPIPYYVYDVGRNWYLGHAVWKKDGITYFLSIPASGKLAVAKPIYEMTARDFSIQAS